MKEAKESDIENKNTLLMDSVKLEMKNNRCAFDEYNSNPEELEGYQEITAYLYLILDYGRTFVENLDLLVTDIKLMRHPLLPTAL